MPQNLFRNLECTIEFDHRLRGQNHINEYIKTVAVALNGVSQATTSPLVYPDNLAVIIRYDMFDTVQNCSCLLFADFGVENESKFVISPHEATSFLWVCIWSDLPLNL